MEGPLGLLCILPSCARSKLLRAFVIIEPTTTQYGSESENQSTKKLHVGWSHFVEGPLGFEPRTHSLKGCRSNQLSYGPVMGN